MAHRTEFRRSENAIAAEVEEGGCRKGRQLVSNSSPYHTAEKKTQKRKKGREGKGDILFDFFFPHPSLSTTSSPHATLCVLLLATPLSLSVPTAPASDPSLCPGTDPDLDKELDSSVSSARDWVSRSVIVRDPSEGAEVCDLSCVARCSIASAYEEGR